LVLSRISATLPAPYSTRKAGGSMLDMTGTNALAALVCAEPMVGSDAAAKTIQVSMATLTFQRWNKRPPGSNRGASWLLSLHISCNTSLYIG
jgi:hypothetical protein